VFLWLVTVCSLNGLEVGSLVMNNLVGRLIMVNWLVMGLDKLTAENFMMAELTFLVVVVLYSVHSSLVYGMFVEVNGFNIVLMVVLVIELVVGVVVGVVLLIVMIFLFVMIFLLVVDFRFSVRCQVKRLLMV
jgi:hypothetical protein